MVTPTPTKIKNGIVGLKYILEGDAHYGDGQRNQYITKINCFDGISTYKQFGACWDLASDQHETQLRHFIISFSKNELSVDNEADIILAHEWATEYFEKTFPGRQILVSTQTDGEHSKGQIIHCHAMVNDCRIGDGRGFTEKERSRGFFRTTATDFFKEKFAEYGIEYDKGKGKGGYGLYEREFAETLGAYKEAYDKLKAEQAKAHPDKDVIKECKEAIKVNKYTWTTHLAQNVMACRDCSISKADFLSKLAQFGVIYDDNGKRGDIKYILTREEYEKYKDTGFTKVKLTYGGTLERKLGSTGPLSSKGLDEYFASLTPKQKKAILDMNKAALKVAGEESKVVSPIVSDTVTKEPESGVIEDSPAAKHHKTEEVAEFQGEAPVPIDSKIAEILLWGVPDIIPDDEDVSDDEEEYEDEELIAEEYSDENPEADDADDAEMIDWMKRVAAEYSNISDFADEEPEVEHEDGLGFK